MNTWNKERCTNLENEIVRTYQSCTLPRTIWTIYRQTLRDIPEVWAGTMNFEDVVWPKRPDDDV